MALLASGDLRGNGQVSATPVFTYGCPRVGNPEFVKAMSYLATSHGFGIPQWRVVHNNDPVPLISPTISGFGFLHYEHTGEKVLYNEKSSAFRVCNSSTGHGEDLDCSENIPVWKWINWDHLTYLNLSFAHGHMPHACTGVTSEAATNVTGNDTAASGTVV